MKEEFPLLKIPDIPDRNAYVVWPDNIREETPWILAIHGSGRDALSYREEPFYIRQRNLALECGCAFAAVSNGEDTWGTPRGFDRIRYLIRYMSNHNSSNLFAVWGSSAGGIHAFRTAKEYPERAALVLGMFPVIDVSAFQSHPRLLSAWNDFPPGSFQSMLDEINPAQFLDQLPDIPVVITHGSLDSTVPPVEHICRYMHYMPGPVEVFMPHAVHSVTEFQLYDTQILKNAILQYVNRIKRRHEP